MSSKQEIFFDPWMKHWGDAEAVPDDAEFLCSFDLDVAIDFVAESAYIRHTDTRSELWIENEFGRGPAKTRRRAEEPTVNGRR